MNEYNCMHILGSERKNRSLEEIQKKSAIDLTCEKQATMPFGQKIFTTIPEACNQSQTFFVWKKPHCSVVVGNQ